MPFFIILPFIVIAIVIFASRSAEMKRQQEFRRRQAEQEQAQRSAPPSGQNQPTPMRPTVRPTVTVQPRTAAPAPQKSTFAAQATHPQHDDCALRPDQKLRTPPQKHPQHEDCSLSPETAASASYSEPARQSAGTLLNYSPGNILQGVVFSEIFGKPKALR